MRNFLELVEMEVRELLDKYEFPGDDTTIIRGSAMQALEGTDEGKAHIQALMDAIDSDIPEPEREIDKPFLMSVEDVFSITGRGTVATGRIERGIIKCWRRSRNRRTKDTEKSVVTGVEMFRKMLDQVRRATTLVFCFAASTRTKSLVKFGSGVDHSAQKGKAEIYGFSRRMKAVVHTPFSTDTVPSSTSARRT